MNARPRVYHVGRAGDIPGGMTQVVNAYLAWPFDRVSVDVIPSRGNPGDHVAGARLALSALVRVRRIARSGERAVIVVHLSERGSFVREGLIARYAASLGLPVIAHMHGSEFAQYEAMDPVRAGRVLRACVKVLTLSEETSTICAKHVPADIIELVPNAIPAGHSGTKTPTVVFGGVVSHRKGIDLLQSAWRAVAADHPDWTLLVAGPHRDEHLVDDALPQTRWLGGVDHSILMSLLDDAAIAVLPSRDEAMPMFILEAMARRACVVSTTVGGIPRLLGDGHGVMVAPGDERALTDALRRAVDDAPWRDRVASAGYDHFVAEYSAEAVYPRVEQIWLSALESPRADQSRLARSA